MSNYKYQVGNYLIDKNFGATWRIIRKHKAYGKFLYTLKNSYYGHRIVSVNELKTYYE